MESWNANGSLPVTAPPTFGREGHRKHVGFGSMADASTASSATALAAGVNGVVICTSLIVDSWGPVAIAA